MDIIENAKLITEFLNLKPIEDQYDFYGRMRKVYKVEYVDYFGRTYLYSDDALNQFIKESKFHCSLDWLLPVICKIENADISDISYKWEDPTGEERCNFQHFEVNIDNRGCTIWEDLTLDPPNLINKKSGEIKLWEIGNSPKNKIKLVYEAVVEFIEWYNKIIETNGKQ